MAKQRRFESLERRNLLSNLPLLPGPHGIPDFAAPATVESVASGAWTDPATWSTATIPGAADVVKIRADHSVSLDSGGATAQAIGVQGVLDISASIRVKDFIVYQDGTLNMHDGTEVVFADSPLDPLRDPQQWGNGLIVQGKWNADGTDKAAYVRATDDIVAGATSFTADAIPQGWQVGDVLALPETAQTVVSKRGPQRHESELVTISAIDGRTIHFATAAQFNHRGISDNPFGVERFAHVANLTRPIVLRSESSDGVRGHTVGTHMAELNVDHVAFVGLGRTRADAPADSALLGANGELITAATNQIGRYSFHTHHLHGGYSLTGSVVQDALKWGVTIHRTNDGLVQNNVVYDVDGAGIATEDGPELRNRLLDNLVIKVDGGYQTGSSRAGVTRVNGVPDTGSEGSGFWFRAPGSIVQGNTVYDAAGYAFNFNGYYRSGDEIPVNSFTRNEAVASRGGLWATWSQACCSASRFHRQEFDDLLVWHTSHEGVLAYHEANMTLRNITVINDPVASSANQGSSFVLDARTTVALHFGNKSYENWNLRMYNIQASGANIGLLAPVWVGEEGALLDGGSFQNYVNIAFHRADPDDLEIRDVTFSPTYVQRISTTLPEQPANVWHSEDGIIEPGEQADGGGGDAGDGETGGGDGGGNSGGGGGSGGGQEDDGDGNQDEQPTVSPVEVRTSGTRLIIKGGPTGDNLRLVVDGDSLRLSSSDTAALATVASDSISRIEFFGNEGNDVFDNQTGFRLVAFGGAGDDTLLGGTGGDSLRGDDGADTLSGRQGDDVIYGDEGMDTLTGGEGSDKLRGGGGNDTIMGGAGSDPVLSGGDGDDRIEGGPGNDRLNGDDGSDLLLGDDGDDNANGGAGPDSIVGAAGNDILYGGDGPDTLLGGEGNDKIRGGGGDDFIVGGAGNDPVLSGGPGNDRIDGGEGNDRLSGDEGRDVLLGGGGADNLHGGDDDDLLFGEAGNDIAYGGAGIDALVGGAGADKLRPDGTLVADLDALEELELFGRLRFEDLLVEEFGLLRVLAEARVAAAL